MDNLSILDDCINTLDQLQLTLDLDTPTIKSHTNASRCPISPRFNPELTSLINYNEDSYNEDVPDLGKSMISSRTNTRALFEEHHEYPKSEVEMLDIQSVSVRRPKLITNMSTDNDLISVPECETTDFPPPPPLLNVDNDNYLNSFSGQTMQCQRSSSKNSSPAPSNNILYHTSTRKTSSNSLRFSPKLLVDSFSPLQSNIYNNTNSESSSQSNISNYTDKEPKSINSFPSIDTMSMKEDPSKQTVVRFFTTDRTTKAVAITEKMSVENTIKILMEKHFWIPSLKSAIVEKVPTLKMERFFEEHECLLSCITSWPTTCGNMIFFEPRDDIYGLFDNTRVYLGENYPLGSINVDDIKNLFISLSNEQHEYQDYLYIKKPGENTWKRKFCLLNHSGIFSIQKKKTKSSSQSPVLPFYNKFFLYTSTGGWTKLWNAPTPFGFAFKPYNIVDPKSQEIMMFCAADEVSMKRWCSNLRLCKYKNQILNNYQNMQNRSLYCSNLFSSNNQLNRFLSLSPTVSNKTSSYNLKTRSSLPTTGLHYSQSNSNKFKF